MRAGPPSPNPRSAPVHSDLARAGRGFVLVFVGALMFFGFVIGSGLLGVLILLVVSSRLHSRAGLWIALACAALPLLWTIDAIFESMWQ